MGIRAPVGPSQHPRPTRVPDSCWTMIASILLPLAPLSFAFQPIVTGSGDAASMLRVHECNNANIQPRPLAFPSEKPPCGKSLGCASCTCGLARKAKVSRAGIPNMCEEPLPLLSTWEMSQVLENHALLNIIRDNEEKALLEIRAFLNENPPSVLG